jgi:hypothetical protein
MRTDLLTNENSIDVPELLRNYCGHVVLSTVLLIFTSIIRFCLRVRQWLRVRSYHTDNNNNNNNNNNFIRIELGC